MSANTLKYAKQRQLVVRYLSPNPPGRAIIRPRESGSLNVNRTNSVHTKEKKSKQFIPQVKKDIKDIKCLVNLLKNNVPLHGIHISKIAKVKRLVSKKETETNLLFAMLKQLKRDALSDTSRNEMDTKKFLLAALIKKQVEIENIQNALYHGPESFDYISSQLMPARFLFLDLTSVRNLTKEPVFICSSPMDMVEVVHYLQIFYRLDVLAATPYGKLKNRPTGLFHSSWKVSLKDYVSLDLTDVNPLNQGKRMLDSQKGEDSLQMDVLEHWHIQPRRNIENPKDDVVGDSQSKSDSVASFDASTKNDP